MGVATLIFASAWFRQAKSIDSWVRNQGEAAIVYALSDAAVETTSQAGSTKLKWETFSELVVSDFDTLLKFPNRNGALTLDTGQVPPSAIEYLKARFRAHGKKIEDKRKKANQPPEQCC